MLPENIRQIGSLSIVGRTAMTVPGIPSETAPDVPILIQIIIPLLRSSSFRICAGVTLMLVWSVVFWGKLMQRGYQRSIPGLYWFLMKQGMTAQKLPNPKYSPKPYEQMSYPGQRVQIDVRFVPACCLVNEAKGKRFYQYTAINEYSRWRYVEAFEEHSTYSSAVFLRHFLERFPMPVECVQTDNGTEFTKRFPLLGRRL